MSVWRVFVKAKAFGANTALSAATNIVLAMIAFATGIMAARLLGPRGRGELAAIQTWPTLIGYLAMLGTGDALVYYSAREPQRAASYLGSAIVIGLLASVPFMAAWFVAMPWVLSAQSAQVIIAARWYLLIVPLVTLVGLPFYPLRGRTDFLVWNSLRLLPTLAWLAILIVAWTIHHREPSLLAYAYLASLAALSLPVLLVVKRRISGSFRPAMRNFGPLLGYGMPCVMTTIPQLLNLRMDQMLMAAFLPPVALGLYVVAVAWSGAITPLLNAVATALFPEVAAKFDGPQRTHAFARGTRLAALVAALTGFMLMAATPWAMAMLFGARFRAAVPAGLILVPAGAIAGVNSVLEDGLRGLGQPALVLQSELTGLVVTAIGLALLLRPLGIVGAAIASILGYGTVSVCLLLCARRVTGASIFELIIPRTREIRAYLGHLRLMARIFSTMPESTPEVLE